MSKVELTREEFNILRDYVARTEDVMPTVKKIMAQGERQLATPIPHGPAKVQPVEVKVGGIDNSEYACRLRTEAYQRQQQQKEDQKKAAEKQRELEEARKRKIYLRDPDYLASIGADKIKGAQVGYAAMEVKHFMAKTEEERQADAKKQVEGANDRGTGTGKPRGPRGYMRRLIMHDEQEQEILEFFHRYKGLKCCGTKGSMLTPAICREYANMVIRMFIKSHDEYEETVKNTKMTIYMLSDDEGLGPLIMAAVPKSVVAAVKEMNYLDKLAKGEKDPKGTAEPLETLMRRVYDMFISNHPYRSPKDNSFTGARATPLPKFLSYTVQRQYFRNRKKIYSTPQYWASLSADEMAKIEAACNPHNVSFNYPEIYEEMMRRMSVYEVKYAAGRKEALARKAEKDAKNAKSEARKAAKAAKEVEK